MLLKSHAVIIDVLPSLPDVWSKGSFRGLVARGNFHISAKWKNKAPYEITVCAKAGGECKIRFQTHGGFTVANESGCPVAYKVFGDGISFIMEKNETVIITVEAF